MNIITCPTRVRMRVFRSRLSLSSATLICWRMISAEVMGRRMTLEGDDPTAEDCCCMVRFGEDRLALSPRALLIRLVPTSPVGAAFPVPSPPSPVG